MPEKNKKKPVKPKHVGTWVLAVMQDGEITKWGKDGDTIFPYPPNDRQAVKQAKYLTGSKTHKDDRFYILHIFNNGQMKQFEFDRDDLD